MQTRLMSVIESSTSTAIGLVVSVIGQIVVSWWYALPLNFAQNMNIVLFFTVLSVIRQYVVRRYFNKRK